MEIIVPATMGGDDGMKMTINLIGPIWIVKGAPGTAEYINFYKGAVEKGWIFSDPRGAKARPARPRRWPRCTTSSSPPAASHTRWKSTSR